jgi:hypothetical protein
MIRLLENKLNKVRALTNEMICISSVNLLNMQSLIEFLFFCSQVVQLERVFMRRLWDFITTFQNRLIKKRILAWIRDDLHWWNELLSVFNEVMFFEIDKSTKHVYIDACLANLEKYVFDSHVDIIDQKLTFRARILDHSNSNFEFSELSINVREMKAILLTFQLHVNTWH